MLEQHERENAAEDGHGCGQARRNVVQNDAVGGDHQGSYGQHEPQALVFQDLPHGAIAKVKWRSLTPTAPLSTTFSPAEFSKAVTSAGFTWPWRG